MVIPTPAASRLFDAQHPLEVQMRRFIRERFAALLGDDLGLLDRPDGLDLLRDKYLPLLRHVSRTSAA